MWFLYQLQESYVVSDAATIGHDLTESETRRTACSTKLPRWIFDLPFSAAIKEIIN